MSVSGVVLLLRLGGGEEYCCGSDRHIERQRQMQAVYCWVQRRHWHCVLWLLDSSRLLSYYGARQ